MDSGRIRGNLYCARFRRLADERDHRSRPLSSFPCEVDMFVRSIAEFTCSPKTNLNELFRLVQLANAAEGALQGFNDLVTLNLK